MPCNNNRTSCNCQSEPVVPSTSTPERVCIQAKRVFDACINQFTQENRSLTVVFPTPVTTFESANSTGDCVISNVVITPQACSTCSRVQYTVTVPITVTALDANGNAVNGSASVSYNQDILMKVPREAVIPTEVECTANIVGVNGSLSGNILTISLCVTLITKIVADVELLVQSYGYPSLCACQEFTEDICSGVFSMPIYPR